MDRVCCGVGHREVYDSIEGVLYDAIIKLIKQKSVSIFYTGGNGEFDTQFGGAYTAVKYAEGKGKNVVYIEGNR